MRRNLLFIVLTFLVCAQALAQEKDIVAVAQKTIGDVKIDTSKKAKKWDIGGPLSINFTQTGFSNWAVGGQNSLGLTGILSFHANYTNHKFSWLNDLELDYGFAEDQNLPLQKTTDQIEATSTVGYKMFDHISASFLANFQTQFAPGYTNPADTTLLSNFMSPGYLVLSLGLNYKPGKDLMIFISPASARLVFVEDQNLANAGDFGVTPAVRSNGEIITPGSNELTEFGAYMKASYMHTFNKKVTVNTNLELFSNYLKNPQNIVVDWYGILQIKISKYLAVTFNYQTIYDNTVLVPIYKSVNGSEEQVGKGPRLQIKDILGAGLGFKI